MNATAEDAQAAADALQSAQDRADKGLGGEVFGKRAHGGSMKDKLSKGGAAADDGQETEEEARKRMFREFKNQKKEERRQKKERLAEQKKAAATPWGRLILAARGVSRDSISELSESEAAELVERIACACQVLR